MTLTENQKNYIDLKYTERYITSNLMGWMTGKNSDISLGMVMEFYHNQKAHNLPLEFDDYTTQFLGQHKEFEFRLKKACNVEDFSGVKTSITKLTFVLEDHIASS